MNRYLLALVVSALPLVTLRAALPVYIEFFDNSGTQVEGSVNVLGLNGVVPGSEFVHAWLVPFDGVRPAGRLQFEELTVAIPAGGPGITLMNALTRNTALERVVFHFARADREGRVEEFFRVTVRDVHVSLLRTVLADTLEPANENRELTLVVGLVVDRVDLESISEGGGVERLRYVRGDLNDDMILDVSDAVGLLLHLFAGRQVACPAAGDSNADEVLDVSDVSYLLNYLFRGGPAIPPPFPGCGDVLPGLTCDADACGAA